MPYSSGTFSRVHDFTSDRDAGIKIQASRTDAEFDGIATALSTAILKDGTQTTTAVVPFAFGISIVDNKAITLGTNSDITIQYDETTNDSLEIAAAVEGAALGIVFKSDQGDDNADQHKLSIADGGTLTLASKISGSFVTYLTHTPNSTVASSTLAVAGNLTVGGNLTLGSGAELSEAELEMLDGITAGTVAASKAVVVDANKDAASFRNITLTGELDAGSLDVSGDIDVDGTSNLDVVDIDGAVDMASTLTVAGVVDITDTTDSSDATGDTGALRVEGGVSIAKKLFVGTDADIDGTLEADAMTLNGTAITTTATLSTGISNGNVLVANASVADNDFLRVDGTSIEGRSASEVLSDISAAPAAGDSNIVTTGALDSGSITSGFGAIDNGTSGIRTNTFTAETSVVPSANDGATLGTASLGFADIFLADGGIIKFGNDQDVTLTHVHDTGLSLNDNLTITTADNDTQLTLLSTDADANVAPTLDLTRDSSSPADDDFIGRIRFRGENDASEVINYAAINVVMQDVSDGTEDGRLDFRTFVAGTERSRLKIQDSEVVINDDAQDLSFRVESTAYANNFRIDGNTGNISIGFATATFATGRGLHMTDDFFLGFGAGNGTRPDFQLGYSGTDTRLDLRCGTGADTADIFFTTGGKIEIGTASATQSTCLHTLNDSTSPTIIARNNNAGSKVFQGRNHNGSESSHITQGGVASFPSGVSSDETLKNVKGEMNDGWSKLKNIQPKSYTWKKIIFETNEEGEEVEVKTDDDLDSNIHYGVMAQDLKKVIPDLAYGEEGGMSVDYNGLLMVAINTIKELEARVTALESK